MNALLSERRLKKLHMSLISQNSLINFGRKVLDPQFFWKKVILCNLSSNAVFLWSEGEMHPRESYRRVKTADFVFNSVQLLLLIKRLMECNLFILPLRIFNSLNRCSKAIESQKLWICKSSFVPKGPVLVGFVRPISVIRMRADRLLNDLNNLDLPPAQIKRLWFCTC